MNFKKLLSSTLTSGFGMWIVAGIWHNLIRANLYESVNANHEGIGLLLVAYCVLALLMSYMYPLGYKGGKPILEGLRFGIVIGILWVFPHELAMAVTHGDSILYVLENGAWHMIEQGIGGIIVGLIYGKL
jgi:hypothetical protein